MSQEDHKYVRPVGTVEGGTKMRQNSSSSSNNDDRKSHISSTFYIGPGYPEDDGQHPRSSDTLPTCCSAMESVL